MTDLCSASERCIGFDRREGQAALAADLPLCEGCLLAAERAVPALVLDYRDLEQHLPPSLGAWGDGQPASRDDHPVPLNLAVEACQREIWWVLTCWEDSVRAADSLSDAVRKNVRDGWAVQAASRILAPRVPLLATLPTEEVAWYPNLDEEEVHRVGTGLVADWGFAGIEHATLPGWRGVLDFGRLHNRTKGLLGLTSGLPERVKLVACRDCDKLTLYRKPGDDRVYCGNTDDNCTAIYSNEEFRRWAGLVAEDAKPKEAA